MFYGRTRDKIAMCVIVGGGRVVFGLCLLSQLCCVGPEEWNGTDENSRHSGTDGRTEVAAGGTLHWSPKLIK